VAPVAAVPDSGPTELATPTPVPTPTPEATEDAGAVVATPTPTPPKPAKPHHGEVEVRVRPYALLYVDGQKVGTTPLDKPLELTAGKHSFRLVNEQYSKDVAVDFTVKPGKSVFKYNLME
jgi:serine/threonine-protein kinase